MSKFKLYLNLINEMIFKIETSVITKEELERDSNLQDATLMRLQVIGENVKNLSSEIKNKHKEIKWKKFERLRNLISHKYSSVNYEIVWKFIQMNLPQLKKAVIKINGEI